MTVFIGVVDAFTSRYLYDLLNIDNPYFEQMVSQIYPTEPQLNKANSSGIERPSLTTKNVQTEITST